MNDITTFDDYLKKIKNLINDKSLVTTKLGRSISRIGFREHEVEPNISYFKDCFENEISPEKVLEELYYNTDELYRKIDDFNDSDIVGQVSHRMLRSEILSDCDTCEIEDELDSRYDTSYVNVHKLSKEELIDLLSEKIGYDYSVYSKKNVICDALGLSNSFSYNIDEIITEIKKIFC